LKAHIVFIDESGILMAPLVRRTWAPVGETPFLYQKGRSYQKVSMIAALTVPPVRKRIGLYFSIHTDRNFIARTVVGFLKRLHRHIQRPLLVVWDRSRIHRSVLVQSYVQKNRRVHIELLPAYAPELNPVEQFWGYLKRNCLANFAPTDIDELSYSARRQSDRIRKRSGVLRSFLYATPLYSCRK